MIRQIRGRLKGGLCLYLGGLYLHLGGRRHSKQKYFVIKKQKILVSTSFDSSSWSKKATQREDGERKMGHR